MKADSYGDQLHSAKAETPQGGATSAASTCAVLHTRHCVGQATCVCRQGPAAAAGFGMSTGSKIERLLHDFLTRLAQRQMSVLATLAQASSSEASDLAICGLQSRWFERVTKVKVNRREFCGVAGGVLTSLEASRSLDLAWPGRAWISSAQPVTVSVTVYAVCRARHGVIGAEPVIDEL